MFSDLFSDIFSPYSTIGEKILALIILLILTATLILLIFLMYVLVDTSAVQTSTTCITTVSEKVYHHSWTSFVYVGNVSVPQYHPERFSITFSCNGKQLEGDISKNIYEKIQTGTPVVAELGIARFSGNFVVNKIEIK